MGRPRGALTFCGDLPTQDPNVTSIDGLFHKECFIDALRCVPHLVVTLFIFPLLLALKKSQPAKYHARTWVHFPWHNFRWVLTFLLVVIDLMGIGEGVLSDSLYEYSHMNLFLPYILALVGTVMSTAYYHNSELCNSPKFLVLLLVYWMVSLGSEIFKVVTLSVKDIWGAYVRRHITRACVLLYGALFLVELDTWRRMKYICFRRPKPLVAPEHLVHLRYVHSHVSLLSRATFFWMKGINVRAFRGYVDWRDLGNLPQEDKASGVFSKFLEKLDIKQLFRSGLTWTLTYKHAILTWCCPLVVIVVFTVVSELMICLVPVLLRLVILAMFPGSGHTNLWEPANVTVLEKHEQYVDGTHYFSNRYIIIMFIAMALILTSLLKETANHMTSRLGVKINNIIKMLLLKKALRLRLQAFPLAPNVHQIASDLVNEDFTCVVIAPVLLIKLIIKIMVCICLLMCYLGAAGMVSMISLFLVPFAYICFSQSRPKYESANLLKAVHQLRLLGWEKHICREIKTNQQRNLKRVVSNALLRNLYAFGVAVLPVLLAMLIFSLHLLHEAMAPTMSDAVTSLLLLNLLRGAYQDLPYIFTSLKRKYSFEKMLNLLKLPEVVGRAGAGLSDDSASDCGEVPDFDPHSRSPSPCPEILLASSGAHSDPEHLPGGLEPLPGAGPEIEGMVGPEGVPGGLGPGAIELTELTPMLGTIKEEGSSTVDTDDVTDTSVSERRVVFTAESDEEATNDTSDSRQPVPSTSSDGSALQVGVPAYLRYHRQHSSGAVSHQSEDSVVHRRGDGEDVDIQDAGCAGEPVLSNINVHITAGKFTIITGPKQAGKRTLLEGLMLGNLETYSGRVRWRHNTRVSYAGYPPWIMEGSLMENITFGYTMDKQRYKKVIKVCCLQQDIDSLPAKDLTLIGMNSDVYLTDGQKNRIDLARAIYASSDTVILNEPLSCMNVNKGSLIFEEGILKYLLKRKRTVILATQQVQFLPFAHKIYRLEEGVITHSGTFQEIKSIDVNLFNAWQQDVKMVSRESYASLSLSMNRSPTNIAKAKSPSKERIDAGTSHNKLQAQTAAGHKVSPVHNYGGQTSSGSGGGGPSGGSLSQALSGSRDQVYSAQTSREQQDDLLDHYEKGPTLSVNHHPHIPNFHDPLRPRYRSRSHHRGNSCHGSRHRHSRSQFLYNARLLWTVLRQSWLLLGCTVLVLPASVMTTAMYVYVAMWSMTRRHTEVAVPVVDSGVLNGTYVAVAIVARDPSSPRSLLTIWLGLGGTALLLNIALHLGVWLGVLHAAEKYQTALIRALTQCRVQALSGQLSRSLSNMDLSKLYFYIQTLVETFFVWLHCVLLIACGCVVVVVSCPYAIIPLSVIAAPEILFILGHGRTYSQFSHLRTSTVLSLKSTVCEFLKGLVCIRAFCREDHYFNMVCEKIDALSNVTLWRNTLDNWLKVRVNLLTSLTFFCISVGMISTAPSEDNTKSVVVTAIIYALMIYYIRDYTMDALIHIKLLLCNVAHVHQLIAELQHDHTGKTTDTPHSLCTTYPREGTISYVDVSLQYDADREPIISNVEVFISAGDKFGLAGPAGSGKTSLTLALVKVIHLTQGNILIDGIDIENIPDQILHTKTVTVLSQQADVLNHTIRFNLDPEGLKSSVELWDALDKVNLKTVIAKFPGQLDEQISKNHLNSTETQCLLLAACVLRKTPVLVLDEVIRPENKSVKTVLDRLFSQDWKHTTVLMITNQPDILLDLDYMAILEEGQVVDHGQPKKLLKRSPHFPKL